MHRDMAGGHAMGGTEAHGNVANDNGGHAYGASNSSVLCFPPQGPPHGVVGGSVAESPSSLSLMGLAPLDVSQGSLTSNALFGSLNLVRPGPSDTLKAPHTPLCRYVYVCALLLQCVFPASSDLLR